MLSGLSRRNNMRLQLAFLMVLLALAGCSSPSSPTATPEAENYTRRREVSPDPTRRGNVLDRHDSLLVTTRPVNLLTLPLRPWFDSATSVQINQLFGWPDSTLQRRVLAALPYGGARLRQPLQLVLTPTEAARLREHQEEWPQLALSQRPMLTYTGRTAATVLGYPAANAQGFLSQAKRYRRGRFFNLRTGGVETYYNGILKGHRGYKHPLVDAQGRQHGTWAADTAFQDGQDLHLSLDSKLQAYAESLLGGRKGYLVALDPRTGEILCSVSAPTYAPAMLTDPDQAGRRRDLLEDEDMPLINRPAMLANPPGSVFKLVNAAIALQLGAITPATPFPCDQSLISCVHRHPEARNLTMALQYSCNPYFYQVLREVISRVPDSLVTDTVRARHVNLAAWRRLAKSFAFDTLLGIDMPRESPGFLPTPAYYDKARRTPNWTYRSIYSLSIGQGEINLTGLQMANMMAIIANKGWYITPHGSTGKPLPRFLPKHYTLVDSANFKALLPGMLAVMKRGGTAEASTLADVGIAIAGKTGTVQNDEGDDHATFVGFAPAQHPKIAIAVYLENAGFGATAAAPCAALVIEKYLRGTISSPRRKRWERRMQYRHRPYQ
jgi:penicillin-binding protein 2